MNKTLLTSVAVAAAIALLAAVASPAAATTDGTENTTNTSDVPPGAQFSAAIAAQSAALTGDVDERAFGLTLANADSKTERAQLIAQKVDNLTNETRSLAETRDSLRDQYENGSISEAEYRSEMARLAMQANTTAEIADRASNNTTGLPSDLLDANGVNVTAIETLRTSAQNLTGENVSRIAQTIAGRTSSDVGPPEHAGHNHTDRVKKPVETPGDTPINDTRGNSDAHTDTHETESGHNHSGHSHENGNSHDDTDDEENGNSSNASNDGAGGGVNP